jgi:ribonuclease HII
MLDVAFEHPYEAPIAGVDEAGRGPWAGPVVAAAVIFDPQNIPVGLNDSKQLSATKREVLFTQIMDCADVGIGIVQAPEIDTLNILQATFKAMQLAVSALKRAPKTILVDGNRLPKWEYRSHAIIGGDGLSVSIAAASIIAKVTRDRIMCDLAQHYPHYGWEKNAGYGTKAHQEGLATFGITPQHRRSYAPIKALLASAREAA